jgi:hypothetical protein
MAFGISPSFKPRSSFHKYGATGPKKKEEEKKPTKPFEDAAKATEGLRENIRKMGEREEEKKKKKPIEPTKGFIGRMMDKFGYGKKE